MKQMKIAVKTLQNYNFILSLLKEHACFAWCRVFIKTSFNSLLFSSQKPNVPDERSQNSLFFPPRKVCFTEHSIHTVCSVLLEKSSLSASMCGTLIYQSHSAADGTSASQRSWLHWGILEDKSHLLSCTRARTNTDKVWQLLACFTTAATRNSSFHP